MISGSLVLSGTGKDRQVGLVAQQTGQYGFLPLLGRGKHRNPRKGACFMELASYLAGERWSDSPACTHWLLAHMARLVNDFTEDASRPRLARLIPSVIGLQSKDPRWDYELALLAAGRALPVAAEPSQRSLAVGMLACERLYAELDGRPVGSVTARTRAPFAEVPLAEGWARQFMSTTGTKSARSPAPTVIECATRAIALACIPDPDQMLHDLLGDAIELCRNMAGRHDDEVEVLEAARWEAVCRTVLV